MDKDYAEIEVSSPTLKEILMSYNHDQKFRVKDAKTATKFIEGILLGMVRIPIIYDIRKEDEIILGKDKLDLLKLFTLNDFKLEKSALTTVHYGDGWFTDLNCSIQERWMQTTNVVQIWANPSEMSKDRIKDMSDCLNFYPFPEFLEVL
jgi:hypothetical protein